MSRHLLIMVLALTLLTSLPVYAQTIAVGTLIGHEGNVVVMTPDGAASSLPANAPVHIHDIIETGPGSRALIVLIDNTEITLGENAQFTIDEYIFDEENESANKARYSAARGAFLYVSGLLAKKKAPDISVNTPYARIGIHGTTFWGGEIDGAYGVLVTDGQVSVQSGRGRISVDKDTGTSLNARTDIPTRAIAWEQEKIDRAIATVTMKNNETLRTRITENADTQKAQREAYKTYLAKSLEERKLLKDTRTPSIRIDNVPTPASPVLTPETTPEHTQKREKQIEEPQKKDAEASPATAPEPSTVPAIDLPSMQGQQQPARRIAPASGATGRSKAADAL